MFSPLPKIRRFDYVYGQRIACSAHISRGKDILHGRAATAARPTTAQREIAISGLTPAHSTTYSFRDPGDAIGDELKKR